MGSLFPQGLYDESATALCRIGTVRYLDDGRAFAYARDGGSALAAGKVNQAYAPTANHLNCAVAAAAAIGDTRVYVTLGATAAAANLYKDGFLHVNDATGEGHLYKVRGHKAIGSAGTGYIELYDKIRVALTTSSEVTLTKHPQDCVLTLPTTATSVPVGIAPIAVTASYYFWNQVKGPAVVLIDGTVVIGQHVRLSDGVAGAVEPLDRDATAEDEACIGTVLRVNAATEYGLIMLAIPGY
jgi:DNA-binding beta-propeller fold protein YncE